MLCGTRVVRRGLSAARSAASRDVARRGRRRACAPISTCARSRRRARAAHRRAHGAQLPAAAVGDRDRGAPLRRRGRRHGLPHPRHAQDDSRAAHSRRSTPCAAAARTTTASVCTTWCSIKENHIWPPARSRPPSRQRARRRASRIEVEVENLDELRQALAARRRQRPARRLHASTTCARRCSSTASHGSPLKLEASGSMSLDNVRDGRRDGRRFHLGRRSDEARPAPSTCRCDSVRRVYRELSGSAQLSARAAALRYAVALRVVDAQRCAASG